MKKMVLLLAFVALASNVWAESGRTKVNMLKLRKMPTSDSVSIDGYPKGEKLEVLSKSADRKWLKVRIISDGKVGYMFASYVTVGGQTESSQLVLGQGDAPAMRFSLTAPASAPEPAESVVVNSKRKERSVSLVASGVDASTAETQTQYMETLQQLTSAKQEIISLKQEVTRLNNELAASEQTVTEYRKRLATFEQVADFRLMSLVEMKGENVFFNGIGTVQMAENNGRVIFKVPAESADIARRLFSKTNKNILEGAQVIYITIEKSKLSIGQITS